MEKIKNPLMDIMAINGVQFKCFSVFFLKSVIDGFNIPHSCIGFEKELFLERDVKGLLIAAGHPENTQLR